MQSLDLEIESAQGTLPLVIRPSGVRRGVDALVSLVRDRQSTLRELLVAHGAILFRGFASEDPAGELSRVMEAMCAVPMHYFGGISPRRAVGGHVYTATELPPGVRIPLHNELSYLAVYPRHLWFACAEPAAEGGETTIADGRLVYRRIDPTIRARFEERGVRYECSFHGASAAHDLLERFQKVTKSWMESFETDDRRVVEERCREIGATPHWLESGRLVLETRRPASIEHPFTGERVWFNSAHLFHLSARGLGRLRYLLSRLYSLRGARTQEASYGDGSPIEPETIEHLFDVMDAATVPVRWQRGDVLWIDNVLTMHGRTSYRGERRVLAALSR